jgi:single-stranded DNA-binding protein
VNSISLSDKEDYNYIEMVGKVCKAPVYRQTKTDREITDVVLAVERPYKTDYIPVITWGRNAKYASGFAIGTKVTAYGRIQSRDFYMNVDGKEEVKIIHEVSVHDIEICHDQKDSGNTEAGCQESETTIL